MRRSAHVRTSPTNLEDISLLDTVKSDVSLLDTVKIEAMPPASAHSFRRLGVVDILLFLVPLIAVSLWAVSLQTVTLNEINDLGLISVLSPRIIVALGLLVVSFVFALQRKDFRVSLLALHLVCLIVIIYGTPNLIEEAPRFVVVYRHAGYTEYIMRTGTVDPYLDTYFDWPEFFVLSAFFTRVFGYSTILTYAGWAPVFFNLIYLGPMYMILASMTTNRRLVWLGLFFFQLTNWVGQDYFSPQALNFFLYLVIVAMLLKWFKISPKKQILPESNARFKQKFQAWLTAPDPQLATLQPWQRRGLLICLIFIFGLVVSSHPLTPFFVLISVTGLVILRRCAPFWLPLLMAAMTAFWILVMAHPFLSQHLNMVIGTLGDLTGNVPKSISNGQMAGDALYQVIAKMRLLMTLLLWFLAFLGAIKRLRQGYKDVSFILLALASFPLIAAQGYGGEMLMRIYLFSGPFMVFFTASLFYENRLFTVRLQKRTRTTSPWMTAAMAAMSLLLLGSFFFTRYGDERVDYVSYSEWNAIQYLYHVAPTHAFILEGWNDAPIWYTDYEKYDIQSLTYVLPQAVIHTDVNKLLRYVRRQRNPNFYLIFTQEQQAHATTWSGLPPDALQRLETEMLQSGEFKLIYSTSDAQIMQYIGMQGS